MAKKYKEKVDVSWYYTDVVPFLIKNNNYSQYEITYSGDCKKVVIGDFYMEKINSDIPGFGMSVNFGEKSFTFDAYRMGFVNPETHLHDEDIIKKNKKYELIAGANNLMLFNILYDLDRKCFDTYVQRQKRAQCFNFLKKGSNERR